MAETRDTRQRLLEAAISIIETDGEDGVRVDRVAEMAGFTKPVVYHHFADRENLVVEALAERYYRALIFAVDEIKIAAARCRSADQFKDLLQQWIDSFGSREGAHRRQLRIEALGAAVSRSVLQAKLIEANERQFKSFAEVLQIAREEGWLRLDIDPLALSSWWSGLILSRHVVEMDAARFNPEDWNSITRWVIDQLIGEQGARE